MTTSAPETATPVRWTLRGDVEGESPFTFRMLPGHPRTVGRAIRADFIVEAPLVSRFHCRLSVSTAGQLEVEDLGSTNGTFVNGRRIERAVLVAGDRLRLGRAELVVLRETPLPEATQE
jgi:pSer/pThr/pTyr-binding forkhead associated (FHA) protein